MNNIDTISKALGHKPISQGNFVWTGLSKNNTKHYVSYIKGNNYVFVGDDFSDLGIETCQEGFGMIYIKELSKYFVEYVK
jgi:hypothetical protein